MNIDRRTFLFQSGLSVAVLSPMSTSLTAVAAPAPRKKSNSMAEWMDAWTGVRARDPVGGLYVYRFKEPMWALLKPIAWYPEAGTSSIARVDVPTGFVTDFASIPRAFYSLLRPDGDYTYPAILHDYLYWTQNRPREECDEVIRLSMIDFKIDKVTVTAIYQAVRRFGQSAWDGNAALKAAGEKRILAKWPEDPRITWAEWKKNPAVFAP
ncbi:DUF1353 domain-containing protein [Bradyrhizobium liaoningense]|uniref:DUF1353 domain-containing protein n=1 Tax=Bradyrhizobium liaoningense TaxID=43992 RepID=UPI001BA7330D|nr:DUF1353 domain-containing protein [Bradyrhizobium liaoningense]MBR0820320.1 DUF1353 domain-containing protein [Bradyrhizobium liaoningense]